MSIRWVALESKQLLQTSNSHTNFILILFSTLLNSNFETKCEQKIAIMIEKKILKSSAVGIGRGC